MLQTLPETYQLVAPGERPKFSVLGRLIETRFRCDSVTSLLEACGTTSSPTAIMFAVLLASFVATAMRTVAGFSALATTALSGEEE